MEISQLHLVPTGGSVNVSGRELTVVYRDAYLGESITLLEDFGRPCGSFAAVRGENIRFYTKYGNKSKPAGECPLSAEEITASGKDELAALCDASDFEGIRKLLPPYGDEAYIPLGHPASERSATVDMRGRIFNQQTSYNELRQLIKEVTVYEPEKLFGELGAKKPIQSFLDGKYPLLFNVHETDTEILESLYVQETGTYRSGGAVYVRNTVTDKARGETVLTEFRIVGTDCPADTDAADTVMAPEVFYDCVLNVLDYFETFETANSKAVLPVKELERSYIGTMFTLEGLFCGERMRYGHRIYGATYHDFFPPNFITALWAYSVNGQTLKAGRLAQYVLATAVDRRGRVLYRQGDGQNYGFSASEIGQFLWILSRYEGIFEPVGCVRPYADKIMAMGNFLLSRICASDEYPDISVIRTCAEADTNERVHDYLENTLWGIRGLEAVCRLGDVYGADTEAYSAAAKRLRADMKKLANITEEDSKFGKLIPFRLGYPALPLTLSRCRDTAYAVSDEEYRDYIKSTHVRSDSVAASEQELVENCYANYRYYPEMLSSALLDEQYEDSFIRMREELGGELLGMIRWGCGADDWPAYNLAVHYMERGKRDKFIRLLYAHAVHHGLCDFHIYYEQITVGDGFMKVRADSSVPSILLNNLMINMMFCYERVDLSEVELLKGIPENWFGGEAFGIEGVYTSRGKLSVFADRDLVKLCFDRDIGEVRLWLNGFGSEQLERIADLNENVRRDGDSLIIKATAGEKHIKLA